MNLFESLSVPVDKNRLSLDACVAKKFMVFLKRKLHRGQLPRSEDFLALMAAVFPHTFGAEVEAKVSVPKTWLLNLWQVCYRMINYDYLKTRFLFRLLI